MFFFVDRVLLATSQENRGRCWRCCRVSLRKIIGITGGYRVPSNGQCNSPDRFIPWKSGSCGNKWATNLASCCFFAAFYRIMLFWSSKGRVVFCNVIEKNKQDFFTSWIPFEFHHNMNDCRRRLKIASFNFYCKKVFKHTQLNFFLIQLFLRIVGSEKYETVKSHAWKGLWVAPRVLRGSGPGRLPCFFMEPTTAAVQSSLTPGY